MTLSFSTTTGIGLLFNFFSLALRLLIISLAISIWGADKYATWIVLSAGASFVSMAEQSLIVRTANRFVKLTMRGSVGKFNEFANIAFICAFAVPFLFLLLVIPIGYVTTFTDFVIFNTHYQRTTILSGLILVFAHTLLIPWAVFLAILRAKYSLVVSLTSSNIMLLIQQLILLVGVYFDFTIIAVVLLILVTNLLSLCLVAYVLKFSMGVKVKKQALLLKKVKLLSLMSLQQWPISVARYFAINLPIFLLSATRSNNLMIWYSSLKTLVGIVTRIIDLILMVNWPSVTRMFIAREFKGISSNLSLINSLMISSVLAAVILNVAFGDIFLEHWLGEVYVPDDILLHLILVHTLVNLYWLNQFQVLIATDTLRNEGVFWLLQTCFFPVFLYVFSDSSIGDIMGGVILLEALIFVPLFRYIYIKKVPQTLESIFEEMLTLGFLIVIVASLVTFPNLVVIPVIFLMIELAKLKNKQPKKFFDRRV